jgi:hypothetical protein
MAKTNAEYSREYRMRKILSGKCIAGCGTASETGCGLCKACLEKYKKRTQIIRKNRKKNKK